MMYRLLSRAAARLQHIIDVHWNELGASATGATTVATSSVTGLSDKVVGVLANFGALLIGSFAGAFLLGFKKG